MRCHHAYFVLAFAFTSLFTIQALDAQTTFEFGGLSQADVEHLRHDDKAQEQHPSQIKLYVREDKEGGEERAEEAEAEATFRKGYPELYVTDGVIVSFGASWCRYCPPQKRRLLARQGQYNMLIFDTEEKRGKALAERWAIKTLPTTVIVHKGKVVKTFIGLTDWEPIRRSAGKARKNEKQATTIQIFPFVRVDIRDGNDSKPDRQRRPIRR